MNKDEMPVVEVVLLPKLKGILLEIEEKKEYFHEHGTSEFRISDLSDIQELIESSTGITLCAKCKGQGEIDFGTGVDGLGKEMDAYGDCFHCEGTGIKKDLDGFVDFMYVKYNMDISDQMEIYKKYLKGGE